MATFGSTPCPTENMWNPLDEKSVVGWLACLSGPLTGQSFTLYEGRNYIGSGHDMAVQILGDPHILQDKHACIAYDSKNREFYLVPGNSDKEIYVEYEAISKATEIVDLNHIRIGTTDLVFRPLCGEEFAWPTQWDMDLAIRAEKEHSARTGTYSDKYEQSMPPYVFEPYKYKLKSVSETSESKPDPEPAQPSAPAEDSDPAPAASTDNPTSTPIIDLELEPDIFDPMSSELTK